MIWIELLEVAGFGPFPEISIQFKPGLNFVVGENEAGKSSLHTAILAILFGHKDIRRFRRDDSTEFRGKLILRTGENRLEIERSFTDDHVIVTQHCENETKFTGRASPLGRSQERIAYLEILGAWLGMSDEMLFSSSLFLAQDALQINPDREAGTQLARMITGSEELPYEAITERLLNRYHEITKVSPDGTDKRQPRELEQVVESISKLKDQLAESEAVQKEYLRLREEQEATDNLLHQLDLAGQKRRTKTEMVAIQSEISVIEEQIEKRASIEERLLDLQNRSIPPSLIIPSVGSLIAAMGGVILGFTWPSIILLLLVQGWVGFKFWQQYNNKRALAMRLEGQLEMFRSPDDLKQALSEARERESGLDSEQRSLEETTFGDLSDIQRRKKEQELRRRKLQISERLALITQRMRSPEAIRDELEETISRKELLERKSQALYLGYQMLRQAASDFKREAFIRLKECASEHFVNMTGNLYQGVHLDDQWQPAAITVTGRTMEFTSLSSGTRDAILLSLRLAISQLISSDKPLPLILDDPIIFMDSVRRELFIERLRPISEEHQIILFTFDHELPDEDSTTYLTHFNKPRGTESEESEPLDDNEPKENEHDYEDDYEDEEQENS